MGLFNNSIMMGASGAGAYEIERSLRFDVHDGNANGAHLQRTFSSAGNRKTWTFSFWAKKTGTGGEQVVFNGGGGGNGNTTIRWDTDDSFHVFEYNSGFTYRLHTNRLFRDPSAWYHIVVTLDTTQGTADNRIKIYVNGVQETSFANRTNPAQDTDYTLNNNIEHTIGNNAVENNNANYYNGYLTEINFVDGTALAASSFGEKDEDTDQWIPKRYGGSHGTNGFYLNFSDNSNTTSGTLGDDDSANTNDWTPNNFSVAAGAGNDSLTDTPTNNFCTANPLDKGSVDIANGGLTLSRTSDTADWELCRGTMMPDTGKWYFEGTVNGNMDGVILGVSRTDRNDNLDGENDNGHWYYNSAGYAGYNGSYSSDPAAVTAGQVVQVAFDRDNNKIWFGVNGTWGLYGGTPVTPSDPNANHTNIPMKVLPVIGCRDTGQVDLNFGQRPFEFTKPTGYKSLCTANIPEPTIKNPKKHFGTLLYTGSASAQVVSGLDFTPDLVINKHRNQNSHVLWIDRVRGFLGLKMLTSIYYSEEGGERGDLYGYITSSSGGFTHATGSDGSNPWAQMNSSGAPFVNWCWLADGTSGSSNTEGDITSTVSVNAPAGFSIVTYTGTGSNTDTVGHGLGVVPQLIIIKRRTNSSSGVTGTNWRLYFKETWDEANNETFELAVATAGAAVQTGVFDDGTPTTSSVFRPNDHISVNYSGDTYVAWCWSEVPGYSRFGEYDGNGSTDGRFVYCGFKPAWLCVKHLNSSGNEQWVVYDNVRDTVNPNVTSTTFGTNQQETVDTGGDRLVDFLSNGFKLRGGDGATNDSGLDYIYWAFAESPFNYSTAQ